MGALNEQLQIFVRRYGLLNSFCCDHCCGEQISLVQSHILFEVRRGGNPPMQRVAEELGMDITTFSRQVKKLEQKGLLSRQVSPEDRRVSLLALTDPGRHMLDRIDVFMSVRLEQVFSRMTLFERETVVRSLGLLNEALVAVDQKGIIACCK